MFGLNHLEGNIKFCKPFHDNQIVDRVPICVDYVETTIKIMKLAPLM